MHAYNILLYQSQITTKLETVYYYYCTQYHKWEHYKSDYCLCHLFTFAVCLLWLYVRARLRMCVCVCVCEFIFKEIKRIYLIVVTKNIIAGPCTCIYTHNTLQYKLYTYCSYDTHT